MDVERAGLVRCGGEEVGEGLDFGQLRSKSSTKRSCLATGWSEGRAASTLYCLPSPNSMTPPRKSSLSSSICGENEGNGYWEKGERTSSQWCAFGSRWRPRKVSASWEWGLGGRGAGARRRHAGFGGWGRGGAEGRGEEGVVDQPWGIGAGLRVSFVETSRECACAGWQGAVAALSFAAFHLCFSREIGG